MLEKLTDEQLKILEETKNEWIQYGLSTEPADRKEAEAALDDAYRAAGKEPPKTKIWVDGPMAGYIASGMLATGDKNEDWTKNAHMPRWYGNQDCWYSWHHTFYKLGLECEKQLEPMFRLAKSCGWIWAYWDVAIMSERPSKINLDDRGRLHCENGPAISFRDGFEICAVHGVCVPKKVIMESIVLEEIDKESNAEVRRVMLDRYGTAKYIVDTGVKECSRDKFGILYKKEVPGDETICMIRVKNSTPEPDGNYKEYWLRVPPTCETPMEGVAWTFGFDKEQYLKYNPEKET